MIQQIYGLLVVDFQIRSFDFAEFIIGIEAAHFVEQEVEGAHHEAMVVITHIKI